MLAEVERRLHFSDINDNLSNRYRQYALNMSLFGTILLSSKMKY